jgi:hypothetical protein
MADKHARILLMPKEELFPDCLNVPMYMVADLGAWR